MSSLSRCKHTLPYGGQPLRKSVLDSTMGPMRVKAAFAAIHAIEGHHHFLRLLFAHFVFLWVDMPALITASATFGH
jgi:hypothetical protein